MSLKTKNGITKKVIAFGDNIIRGLRVREFNEQVKNSYAKFRSFPGCNSKEMLHYIEPTLETGFKCLLANKFIFVLSIFLKIHAHYPFLEKNTHHPPVRF